MFGMIESGSNFKSTILMGTQCRVATTAALTATYDNTAGTLTNSGALAAIAIDSVSLAVNDRVVVKDQVTQTENGVYKVTTVGSGAIAWVLTRDEVATSLANRTFIVTEGTTNHDKWYTCTNDSIIFGTTNIVFSVSGPGAYAAGTGLTLTGTTFAGDFETNATQIKMDGVQALGSSGKLANSDHVHPSDTTKVDGNVAITPGTNLKITYDAKGLVTAGTAPTTADVPDSTNARYVTDAQLSGISGNVWGINWNIKDIIDGGNFALKTGVGSSLTGTGSGTLVSIAASSHGLNTGDQVIVTASSDLTVLPLGVYPVTRVDANTFTVPYAGVASTSTVSYELTVKGVNYVPFKFTATGWKLRGDQSGAITLKIYYASTFTGTFAEITGGGISISSGYTNSGNVSAWGTTVFAANGILKYAITSNAGSQQNLSLEIVVDKTA